MGEHKQFYIPTPTLAASFVDVDLVGRVVPDDACPLWGSFWILTDHDSPAALSLASTSRSAEPALIRGLVRRAAVSSGIEWRPLWLSAPELAVKGITMLVTRGALSLKDGIWAIVEVTESRAFEENPVIAVHQLLSDSGYYDAPGIIAPFDSAAVAGGFSRLSDLLSISANEFSGLFIEFDSAVNKTTVNALKTSGVYWEDGAFSGI